jgi:hypothetical protein
MCVIALFVAISSALPAPSNDETIIAEQLSDDNSSPSDESSFLPHHFLKILFLGK